MLQPYKRYYIYVAAVPAPSLSDAWYVHALVLPQDKLTPLTEIKKFDETALVFHTKDEAENHGLSVSKAWVDMEGQQVKKRSLAARVRN
jgi:hypothetical protein